MHGLYLRSKDTCIRPYQGLVQLVVVGTHRAAKAALWPQQSCQWDTESFSATTAVLPMGHKELFCDNSSLANGTQRAFLRQQQSCQWDTESFSATTAVLPMGHKELPCDHSSLAYETQLFCDNSSLANGTQRAFLWPQQSCQWDIKSFPVTTAVLPMGHKELPCDHSSLANGTQRAFLQQQQSCQWDTKSCPVTTAVLPMGHKELPCDHSSPVNGTQRAALWPQQSCQWDTKSCPVTTAVLSMGHKELPCDHSSPVNGTQRAALWPQQSCQWDTRLRKSCTLGRHWLPSRQSYSHPFLHHIKIFFLLFFQHRTNPISRTSTSHGTNNTRNVSFPTDCNNSLLQIQDKMLHPEAYSQHQSCWRSRQHRRRNSSWAAQAGAPCLNVLRCWWQRERRRAWCGQCRPVHPSVCLCSPAHSHNKLICTSLSKPLAATHHSMPIFPTTNVHCQSVFGCRTIDGATDNKLTHN